MRAKEVRGVVTSAFQRQDGKWSVTVKCGIQPVTVLHHEEIEVGKRVTLVGDPPNMTIKA